MQTTFAKIVQRHFQFLVNEFGFSLLAATESPRGDRWEGDVQYMTQAALIDLNCTRGELPSLWIGRTKDEKKHLLPIQVIYEYMTLTDQEKRIVLSISEGRQASQILNEKHLAHPLPQSDTMEEKIDVQLEIYARSLRESIMPFLKGDFSQWLAIWEYHVEKLTIEYTRDGLPEFVPVVITDDNGKFRVIGKQHVFKQNLDYISELKGEQSAAA